MCRYARSLVLAACQNTPAIDGAFYRPDGTSYQLQPSFHTSWTEPEPTARARRAGEEFYAIPLRPAESNRPKMLGAVAYAVYACARV